MLSGGAKGRTPRSEDDFQTGRGSSDEVQASEALKESAQRQLVGAVRRQARRVDATRFASDSRDDDAVARCQPRSSRNPMSAPRRRSVRLCAQPFRARVDRIGSRIMIRRCWFRSRRRSGLHRPCPNLSHRARNRKRQNGSADVNSRDRQDHPLSMTDAISVRRRDRSPGAAYARRSSVLRSGSTGTA